MTEPHPAPAAPEPAADPKVGRSEVRITKMARLSDLGLDVAETVTTAAKSGEGAGVADAAEAFAKVSRAIRLTITLEAKLDDALSAYLAGEIAKVEARKAEAERDAYAPLKSGKKARARQLLRDVIDREIPDPEDHEVLCDALDERLLVDDAYDHIDDLPLRDIVEHLCKDLQLKPDWKRWTGEGWKPNPPFFRPLSSDFSISSRRPILADLAGPYPSD